MNVFKWVSQGTEQIFDAAQSACYNDERNFIMTDNRDRDEWP